MADADRESSPGTAPFVPDFDTDEHSQPLKSPAADKGPTTEESPAPEASGQHEPPNLSATAAPQANGTTGDAPPVEPIPEQPAKSDAAARAEPIPPQAQSVTVPGRYYYLKWWKLVLVIAGVWIVAAAIGLGLFSWWYHAVNKTPAVFVVLVYVVVCTVGGLMLAMVPDKPLLSALAIAAMSAVFASLAAAAPLYGHYYCAQMPHCLLRIIPY